MNELATIKWTAFMDMHSGGGLKEKYSHIFIEAPEGEAILVFYNRFGHSPYRVSCSCCGEDYSISEYDSLAEATRYHRNANEDEERYTGTDSIILRLIAENKKRMPEQILKLYAMAQDKASPREASIAMDKIVAQDMLPLWRAHRYISLEEFERTGELKDGEKGLVIRAADIKPEERTGSLPRQGWVWED
jgi:hypothetical protein